MAKRIITIDGILRKYFDKQWIIRDLRDIGENTSGTKDELINRFLQSQAITSKSVNEVAQNLIESLRKTELVQIMRDHNLNYEGNRDQLLGRIMKSFDFEPYITLIERPCRVCNTTTDHEVHFNDSWNASYFRCTVCHNEQRPREEEKKSDGHTPTPIHRYSDSRRSDVFFYIKRHYYEIIPLFIAASIGLGIKYGWINGILSSLIITSIVSLVEFLVIEGRKKQK